MQTREQVRLWRKKLEGSAETPGGAAETVGKIEGKFFIGGWGKNNFTKTNLVKIQSENMT